MFACKTLWALTTIGRWPRIPPVFAARVYRPGGSRNENRACRVSCVARTRLRTPSTYAVPSCKKQRPGGDHRTAGLARSHARVARCSHRLGPRRPAVQLRSPPGRRCASYNNDTTGRLAHHQPHEPSAQAQSTQSQNSKAASGAAGAKLLLSARRDSLAVAWFTRRRRSAGSSLALTIVV
jgi:hypothetical protein